MLISLLTKKMELFQISALAQQLTIIHTIRFVVDQHMVSRYSMLIVKLSAKILLHTRQSTGACAKILLHTRVKGGGGPCPPPIEIEKPKK